MKKHAFVLQMQADVSKLPAPQTAIKKQACQMTHQYPKLLSPRVFWSLVSEIFKANIVAFKNNLFFL